MFSVIMACYSLCIAMPHGMAAMACAGGDALSAPVNMSKLTGLPAAACAAVAKEPEDWVFSRCMLRSMAAALW